MNIWPEIFMGSECKINTFVLWPVIFFPLHCVTYQIRKVEVGKRNQTFKEYLVYLPALSSSKKSLFVIF